MSVRVTSMIKVGIFLKEKCESNDEEKISGFGQNDCLGRDTESYHYLIQKQQ